MRYGLIGKTLSHSFSGEIHALIGDYEYELLEIAETGLDAFFENRDFSGINVTIPYKTEVIKYLDFIDDAAKQIGAVNTVLNRGGKLYGYNTDAFGLAALIEKNGVDLLNKKVLVLGGGGTSKTAAFVAKKQGAKSVYRVSRSKKEGLITYDEAKALHTDADVIINTTPVGMFPNISEIPVDIKPFTSLKAVIDVIYNPLKSRLVLAAEKREIPASGGLYMLIAQAYKAAQLFTGSNIDITLAENAYEKVLTQKRNIVLIGMPSAGKTTIGQMLSRSLDMSFFDSDEQITLVTGKTPAEIIKDRGEAAFREIESKVIYELSLKNHVIIATGGGTPTVHKNTLFLKANGKIYFIDRPLTLLTPTADRPLSSSKPALINLYNEREPVYKAAADERVINDKDASSAVNIIRKDFYYENFSNQRT